MSFEIIFILLYISFSPEILTKTWTIDRGIFEFDHFNAFLKLQQTTYAYFMPITMPQSFSYD